MTYKLKEQKKNYILKLQSLNDVSYGSNQQYATIQVNLLFLVSSIGFGRCFRPSSGALDRIYSIW